MRTKRHPSPAPRRRRISSYVSMVILGLLTVTGSFAVGVQTAGDVTAISGLRAGGPLIAGDMNGNGILDRKDAAIILEVVQGYREPSADLLRADPNGDGHLTVDDAIRVLNDIASV